MTRAYLTVEGNAEAEVVEKRSRFISHLGHASSEEEAWDLIRTVRERNSQARHNVYAYLLRSGRTRYSDDGEPAQTAGLPTFEVLEHAGLSDVVIVTTRYFGGILLGTGGLVRAYTSSAKEAVSKARLVRVCPCVDVRLEVPYDMEHSVRRAIDDSDATISSCDYTDRVTMVVTVRKEAAGSLAEALTEATRGKAALSMGDPYEGVI